MCEDQIEKFLARINHDRQFEDDETMNSTELNKRKLRYLTCS